MMGGWRSTQLMDALKILQIGRTVKGLQINPGMSYLIRDGCSHEQS